MNRCEDGVSVNSRSASAGISSHIWARRGAIPEGLHEAKDVRSLGRVGGDGRSYSKSRSKGIAFTERTMLHSCCEERGRADFFPEIKASQVNARLEIMYVNALFGTYVVWFQSAAT